MSCRPDYMLEQIVIRGEFEREIAAPVAQWIEPLL